MLAAINSGVGRQTMSPLETNLAMPYGASLRRRLQPVELPAIVFLGWWFVMQFFNGTLSLLGNPERVGGIAWWAHIGGFAFGLIVALFFRDERRRRRTNWDEEDRW